MVVSCLTGEVLGLLRKEEAVSVSEVFQFVILLCAVSKLFYDFGKDINANKKEEKNTKK